MLTMFENETTETVIRKVLGLTYDRFGFKNDTHTVERVAAILAEPVPADASEYEAAGKVREVLWNRYSGGGASAGATCNLFFALGRESELGWVIDEAHYTQWNYDYFINQLSNAA
jgi:hypothetical protein